MEKYYFTYGTSAQFPYFVGWTEVEAENKKQAIAIFRIAHPDKTEGIINCSSIYSEHEFKKGEMYNSDNLGSRCHEKISLSVEIEKNEIEKIKDDVENLLKKNPKHKDKHIDYILINSKNKKPYIIASNGDDEITEITLKTLYFKIEYDRYITMDIPTWDYNLNDYLYKNLEEDYKEIAYVSDESHYNIWCNIAELYPNDIEFKRGMHAYLDYCKNNRITKQYIDEKVGLQTPDIMRLCFHRSKINMER